MLQSSQRGMNTPVGAEYRGKRFILTPSLSEQANADPWNDYDRRNDPGCSDYCYHVWGRNILRTVGICMPKRAIEEPSRPLVDAHAAGLLLSKLCDKLVSVVTRDSSGSKSPKNAT